MGFLDNSGDIILDAVLTDAGRQRLARGDGSFKVVQFALGDDEINYGLYDPTNASGSAYYDINILQTPVLEAFTNNIASLNSKLLSIPRTDLLYLPVIKINSKFFDGSSIADFQNSVVISVDQTTEALFSGNNKIFDPATTNGLIFGYGVGNSDPIVLVQGLDTNAYPPDQRIDPDLKETQYMVEIDNRFGTIIDAASTSPGNTIEAAKSFVDDDQVAQYFFSMTDSGFVGEAPSNSLITGPRGTSLRFSIRASLELSGQSTYLFDTLGSSITVTINSTSYTFKIIKSSVIVTGATTGYSITVPVTFIKKV